MQEEEGTSGKWYILNLVPQEILVMAPKLQEDLLGTKVKKGTLLISMSLYLDS